ncbi:hypothetical protein QTP86_016903, partial [Hemibagrus guttatus]
GLSEGIHFSQSLWVSGGEHIVYSEEGDGNLSDFYSSLIHTHTHSSCVRLVNGGSRCAGRVEVLQDGQWGTVCGRNWDKVDAAVVCRELRCGEAVNAPQYGHFGPGSGPIWMVSVSCRGSESTLKKCGSQGRGERNCNHGLDAGVICSGLKIYTIFTQLNKTQVTECRDSVLVLTSALGEWRCFMEVPGPQCVMLTLTNGMQRLCVESWTGGFPVKVLGSAAFGRGEGQVWTEELQCRGTESEISFCPTSSSLKHSDCSHDNDVGLIFFWLSIMM